MMDVVKEWAESGLLKGVFHKEHRKTLAMSLHGAHRRLMTMEVYTPKEKLWDSWIMIFSIVRRLVVKAGFAPITDFSGLIETLQQEYKRFSLEHDMRNDPYGGLQADFIAEFCDRHAGMF